MPFGQRTASFKEPAGPSARGRPPLGRGGGGPAARPARGHTHTRYALRLAAVRMRSSMRTRKGATHVRASHNLPLSPTGKPSHVDAYQHAHKDLLAASDTKSIRPRTLWTLCRAPSVLLRLTAPNNCWPPRRHPSLPSGSFPSKAGDGPNHVGGSHCCRRHPPRLCWRAATPANVKQS